MIRNEGVIFIDLFIIILFVYIVHAKIGDVVVMTDLRLISDSSRTSQNVKKKEYIRIELFKDGKLKLEGKKISKSALWRSVIGKRVNSIMLMVDVDVTWTDAGKLIHEISNRGFNVILVSSPAK